ncbi:efflux RND transporter periplasmic adaptor subunit [Methylobacterium sp. 77]|uniref:efflux RND transporter periplasmic adaptor subunit n=1 Tax=Methylobacterium sp. 77 TaxID=1101192 RepID=UPI00035CDE6D|nr:efflux RND transporter periplasmic adaptor subunit [Methylobacterium sp. 77]
MQRRAKLFLALTGAAGLAVAVIAVRAGAPGFSEQAPRFITLPVRLGDIEDTVLANGTIEPTQLVSVGAQVSGRLVALHAGLGDRVKAGQLIAEIDSMPQENAVQKAQAILASLEAQRDRARANLKQTELAHKRQSDILSGRAGTRQDYETAEASHAIARADLANFEAQIDGAGVEVRIARTNLAYTRITAPIDGTVVAVITRQGQTVISAQTAPTIVKLADLTIMSVKARVSEADIGRLQAGTPVVLTSAAQPGRRYEARLRSIDPAPDQILAETSAASQGAGASQSTETPIYFNARFEIANPDGLLRPLMTAQISFVLARATQAALVPAAALRRTGEGRGLLTLLGRDGRTEERAVRTGITNGMDIEIVEGAAPGEAVVVAGPQDIAGIPRVPL